MYKVFLDISLGFKGYFGISQDMRALYSLFCKCPLININGLIYNINYHNVNVLNLSYKDKSEKIKKQSLYLDSLLNDNSTNNIDKGISYRIKKKYERIYNIFLKIWLILFKRNIKIQELENDLFWDFIWRNNLGKGLDIKDIDFIKKNKFHILDVSLSIIELKNWSFLFPKLRLDIKGDFVIFETSNPITIKPSKNIIKIIRYHDIIPLIKPDLIDNSTSYTQVHHRNIKLCLKDSYFVCNSEPTREDLIKVFPSLEEKSFTIPNIISDLYYPTYNFEKLKRIFEAKDINIDNNTQYVLNVSAIEPKKNHINLIKAFEILKEKYPKEKLILVFVGNLGWKYEKIWERMKILIKNKDLVHLTNVEIEDLRLLYSHASVFCFPSLYEGFGMPPVEALRCETPCVVSDIPSLKWVLGEAALYSNPYAPESIASQLERLIFLPNKEELKKSLLEKGKIIIKKYEMDTITNKWLELFEKLKNKKNK